MVRFTPLVLAPLIVACQPDPPNIQQKIDPEPDPAEEEAAPPLRQPDIEVEPAELRFGARPPGCASDPRTVTVRNVGNNPLQIHDLRLAGQQASAFEMLDEIPTILRAGEEATFRVVFTPEDYIQYDRARVIIESNDPDEPEVRTGLRGAGDDAISMEELFVQQQADAVDVLFVLDNSGSMTFHIRKLRDGMRDFIRSFVQLGLDYRLGITTTHADPIALDNSGDPLAPGSIVGTEGRFVDGWMDEARNGSEAAVANEFIRQTNRVIQDVGVSEAGDWEKAFDATHASLTAPRINQAPNQGFLRTDATLAVVVIGDEDDQSSMLASPFSTWLASLKGGDMGRVSFSAITGQRQGFCGNLITGAFPAPRFHAAINQTGGIWGNICRFDGPEIQKFLRHLSFVAAGMEVRFPLSDEPIADTTQAIQVQICDAQGACRDAPRHPEHGWQYLEDDQAIEMNGDWIPDPGETLVITYAVAGDCPT